MIKEEGKKIRTNLMPVENNNEINILRCIRNYGSLEDRH